MSLRREYASESPGWLLNTAFRPRLPESLIQEEEVGASPWSRLAVYGAKGDGRSHVPRRKEGQACFSPSAAEAQSLPEQNDPGKAPP